MTLIAEYFGKKILANACGQKTIDHPLILFQ
jgi:hypothetical protein